MTAPTLPPLDTSTKNFGPDSSQTPAKPKPLDPKPPKASTAPLSNLGKNRASTRAVPALSEEDRTRIEAWYHRISKICTPFLPRLAAALSEQAEDCTNSWFALAENNAKVRKILLGIIEGGDWGAVIGAHTPILMAVIPERVIERIMLRGMGMFAQHVSQEDEPQYDPNFPYGGM